MEDEYKVVCELEWCHFRWPWVTPDASFKVTVYFKGKYLTNGACNPLHVWFYARVFGVGGSNGDICGSIKSKVAADGHLGYTKMAITSEPLCRSTWCLVLVWGFRDGRSNGTTFSDLEWPRTPVSRSQYSLKAHISQTVHAMAKCISALCVYDEYTILETISPHFQMTRTSRGPSATAELLVKIVDWWTQCWICNKANVKDSTTSQTCCYTTFCVQKSSI